MAASLIALSPLKAQKNLDFGIFFGVSHYMGDLHRSHVEVLELNEAKGLFCRYNLNKTFSLRFHFMQGLLTGKDSNYPTLETARLRNLSFRSTVYEAGFQWELQFMNFGIYNVHASRRLTAYRASSYLLLGLSGFYFNPRASYNGTWYDLQPLGTEGQGMEGYSDRYNRYQLAIPLGFGFKIRPGKWSTLGFEVGFRHTFTDYLDDVSGSYPDLQRLTEHNPLAAALSYRTQEIAPGSSRAVPSGMPRGSDKSPDKYVFAGMTLSISLGRR
ncbi:MAG: hypothetical protein RI973_880 [Bacteroidota bacterium]|jgi:hypothetical protein